MNTFIIKQLAFSFAFLSMHLLVRSQEDRSRNNDLVEARCVDMANKMASCHEWVSFKVETSYFRNKSLLGTGNKTCSIHYGEEFLIYYHDWSKDTYSCLTITDYKEVDNKNRTISDYSLSGKDSLLAYLKHGFGGVLRSFFDFLYYLYPTFLGEAKIVDEIFNDEDVIATAKGDRIRFMLEKSAFGKDLEEDADSVFCQYFINPVCGLLDSVCVSAHINDGYFNTNSLIYDFDFSDKQISIDSVFDFENPRFKGYSYKQ